MKKNKNIIILICLVIAILIASYCHKYITPFGNTSFLEMDFYHQYFPMTSELYDRIFNKLSLIYSFNMGLGIPIYRNFLNYLSSPLNILVLLFKRSYLLTAYTLIISIRIIISAVSMYLLLRKKFKDHFILIPISIMYTFSNYFLAYYWNIMWMDGFSLLPLVILGLERLVDKDKSLLYILALSYVIYCNYYIAFMICMFCVLYFVMYLFTSKKYNKKELIKKTILFICSSLLVGLLCSFFLLPLYYSIKSISAVEGINIPTSLYYDFKVRDFFFNHLSFVITTISHLDGSNTPNISCGVLSLLLIIPFIFNNKIDLKIRIGYMSLLIFMGLSFHISALDYFWHVCHVPNDLPYRFSFLYSFILVVISAYSIINIKYASKISVIISYILVMSLIIYLNIVGYDKIENTYVICNYVLATLYFIFYFIYKLSNNNKNVILLFLITFLLSVFFTIKNTWMMDSYIPDYYRDYKNKTNTINEIYKHDNKFYRIGSEDVLHNNDGSWYGYRGVSTFSSMEYKQVVSLVNKLGFGGNKINSFSYTVGNKLIEILLDIKYGIYRDENTNTFSYYEMPFSSNLMFRVDKDIYDWNIDGDNPFEIQNDFVRKSYAVMDIYKKIEPIKSEIVYQSDNGIITKYIYKSNKNNIYTYEGDSNLTGIIINDKMYLEEDSLVIESNLFEIDNYISEEYKERYIIEESNDNNNIVIYTVSKVDSIEPLVYELNEELLEEFDDKVISNSINITSFNEDNMTLESNVDKPGVVYTSIPYDKGWKVYVDDKRVETSKIGDAFLSFNIDSGKHNIRLEYSIPYLGVGIIISIISLITIIILNKKKII